MSQIILTLGNQRNVPTRSVADAGQRVRDRCTSPNSRSGLYINLPFCRQPLGDEAIGAHCVAGCLKLRPNRLRRNTRGISR